MDAARALLKIGPGGPVVNAARCRQVLEFGMARGFEPAPDAAERLPDALREGREWAVH